MPTQNELLTSLAQKGCEIDEILADTYCGNEALMARLIGMVPATDCLQRMEEALKASDVNALFEASHELKGLYATTALTPLHRACCEIVEIARAGSLEGAAERTAALAEQHRTFCELIRSFSGK